MTIIQGGVNITNNNYNQQISTNVAPAEIKQGGQVMNENLNY